MFGRAISWLPHTHQQCDLSGCVPRLDIDLYVRICVRGAWIRAEMTALLMEKFKEEPIIDFLNDFGFESSRTVSNMIISHSLFRFAWIWLKLIFELNRKCYTDILRHFRPFSVIWTHFWPQIWILHQKLYQILFWMQIFAAEKCPFAGISQKLA